MNLVPFVHQLVCKADPLYPCPVWQYQFYIWNKMWHCTSVFDQRQFLLEVESCYIILSGLLFNMLLFILTPSSQLLSLIDIKFSLFLLWYYICVYIKFYVCTSLRIIVFPVKKKRSFILSVSLYSLYLYIFFLYHCIKISSNVL